MDDGTGILATASMQASQDSESTVQVSDNRWDTWVDDSQSTRQYTTGAGAGATWPVCINRRSQTREHSKSLACSASKSSDISSASLNYREPVMAPSSTDGGRMREHRIRSHLEHHVIWITNKVQLYYFQ